MYAIFIDRTLASLTAAHPAALPETVVCVPVAAALERYVSADWQDEDGALVATGTTLETFRTALLARLAACRWEAEVGGVVIDGKRWHSDPRGRAALVESAVLSAEWEAAHPDESWETDWKTADGFIRVTRPQLVAAAFQVAVHVQAVFKREASLSAQIAEGDFEQLAALAADIEGRW